MNKIAWKLCLYSDYCMFIFRDKHVQGYIEINNHQWKISILTKRISVPHNNPTNSLIYFKRLIKQITAKDLNSIMDTKIEYFMLKFHSKLFDCTWNKSLTGRWCRSSRCTVAGRQQELPQWQVTRRVMKFRWRLALLASLNWILNWMNWACHHLDNL